jgi:hypothetical protein
MLRIPTRLAAFATLVLAGTAFGQVVTGPPAGVPMSPGGPVPPGGLTEGVTGREATIAEQVDEMNRHINGDRVRARNSSALVDRARAATAAEVVAGAAVSDTAGVQLGTIESVDAGGAVILTAAGRARIPLNAFGKNSHGLLLQTSKAQFEATVAHANASPS